MIVHGKLGVVAYRVSVDLNPPTAVWGQDLWERMNLSPLVTVHMVESLLWRSIV
jgi:hypothetical protein